MFSCKSSYTIQFASGYRRTFIQPIICIWFNSEAILLGLKQDPEVARLAAVYLKWAVLGLPAYSFNGVSR